MNPDLLSKKENFWLKNSDWVGHKVRSRIILACFILAIFLFLPWTQNIQTTGNVTTLLPSEQPQEIQTIIAGRITRWRIKDGDFVKKGDTICVLDEVKSEYLNPDLLSQTDIQIQAKEQSVLSYNSKISSINDQIKQLEAVRDLSFKKAVNKIDQEQLKLNAELAEYTAASKNAEIAKKQFERDSSLGTEKLRSSIEVENRRLKWQESIAKLYSAEAKVKIARASLENAKIELQNIRSEYGEKLSKTESERYSAISAQLETEAEVSKLRNSYANYAIRAGFYYILAPQSGIISKTLIKGIGETVKEGDAICTIVPDGASMAVAMNVKPVDLPLFSKNLHVQFVFDGWPTIVFSGWPQTSYGTFPGEIYAIDNNINEKGEYRVLVKPAKNEKNWPEQLKVGVGARGFVLLKTVPVWYEIWRQLNGFPPDFYKSTDIDKKKK